MARKAVQKIKVNKTKSDSVSLLDTGSFSVYMEVILWQYLKIYGMEM